MSMTGWQEMASPRHLVCPNCYGILQPQDRHAAVFQCPHCAAWIRFSPWPVVLALVASLLVSLLIAQFIGLRAYAAIAWIPIFFVSLIFVPRLIPVRLPLLTVAPSPKAGWRRNLILFLSFWVSLTLYMVAYGFVLGWGAFFLRASPQDIREIADMCRFP